MMGRSDASNALVAKVFMECHHVCGLAPGRLVRGHRSDFPASPRQPFGYVVSAHAADRIHWGKRIGEKEKARSPPSHDVRSAVLRTAAAAQGEAVAINGGGDVAGIGPKAHE